MEKKTIRKKKQDTTEEMVDKIITDEPNAHQYSSMDNHLMIKESKIVDAKMSDFSNLHPLAVHFTNVLLLKSLPFYYGKNNSIGQHFYC